MSVTDDAKKRMMEVVDHLKKDYKNLRTGRVNPHMLDDVMIEVYGSNMPLKSVATISASPDRQLLVTPFDKSTLQTIAKSIETSPLKMQATVDGNQVRVPVPALTEDVRKDVAKQAKKKCEDAKVSVRQVRREFNDRVRKMKADSEITEDMEKKFEKQIQEHTDQHCKILDEVYQDKEKDIMTV